jgi:hypothetical protein
VQAHAVDAQRFRQAMKLFEHQGLGALVGREPERRAIGEH